MQTLHLRSQNYLELEAAPSPDDADEASAKYKRHARKNGSRLSKLLRHIPPFSKTDKMFLMGACVFFLLCVCYSQWMDSSGRVGAYGAYGPTRSSGELTPDDAFPIVGSPSSYSETTTTTIPAETSQHLISLEHEYAHSMETMVHSIVQARDYLHALLDEVNTSIINNVRGGIRWTRPDLLPPIREAVGVDFANDKIKHTAMLNVQSLLNKLVYQDGLWFWTLWKKMKPRPHFQWMEDWVRMKALNQVPDGPPVDYTDPAKYNYPPKMMSPPANGGYPKLQPMKEVFDQWPQDEDYDGIIDETLIYFDCSNPIEREASKAFIEKELPFKLINVPEVDAAHHKWTDEYLSEQFDSPSDKSKMLGLVQESPNNFFCFFNKWDIHTMGLPPVRNNDMTYREFSEHAKYAEASRLDADMPHFYYQAGDFHHSRYSEETQTFIGRDLPSFGSTENTYFVFNVEEQGGIQCRMGERGSIAATHQDGGRNMIAMVHGAKRYILSPPSQCDRLGIFPDPVSPLHRHSMVNYGHMAYLDDPTAEMSSKERAWLERAATSGVIQTVLKEGEVMYLPSHWFHYIISLQRSMQCNVRSGKVKDGSPEFGGQDDVDTCGEAVDWGITDLTDPRVQASIKYK